MVFEDFGIEERRVGLFGLFVRSRAFGMVLQRILVEFQRFLNLYLFRIVDLIAGLAVGLKIERFKACLYNYQIGTGI